MMENPHSAGIAEESGSARTRMFWLLVGVVTIAFFWILLPFYGALFWATAIAVLFIGVQRRMVARTGGRHSLSALLTLLLVLIVVIVPLAWVGTMITREAAGVYVRIQSGEVQPSVWLAVLLDSLPSWASHLPERFGLQTLAQIQERFGDALSQAMRLLLQRGLSIGQGTFGFVVGFILMLYLLFFLLRDGDALIERIGRSLPLQPELKHRFGEKFATVVRATIKGTVVIAVIQGVLGAIAFHVLGIHGSMLWGVAMAILSLLPAVGPVLIWLPVALYLVATGAIGQGVGLILFGTFVIGLVDNGLRPILVGKDTKMPDYVVLFSTLGGLSILGINGFVIGPVVAALFIAAWEAVATTNGKAVQMVAEETGSGGGGTRRMADSGVSDPSVPTDKAPRS